MDDTAITVKSVSKNFILPQERVTSIKSLVTNISKSNPWRVKHTQHALKKISFEVKKGEFFGIIGRNGSGKSTILKILANIYQPSSGTVQTFGKLVPFIELGVGFNPELTGRENVYLNGAMLGFSKKEVDRMYTDIVEFAELKDFMDQKLKNYSSGMQVRLAFSMATRAKADILLVDEVLAVGDESFQRKCFQYFKSLKKNKTTVVFVTHDMGAVREFCDKAILIEKSKIKGRGTGAEIADLYSQLFIDEPVNIIKETEDRWGDGIAKIYDLKVYPRLVKDSDRDITIKWKVNTYQGINEPLHGFTIKSSTGEPLIGTNSQLSRIKAVELEKNSSQTISWTFENVLPEGLYNVVPAICSSDGTVHDWWENAEQFEVRRATRNPYPIQPNITGDFKDPKVETEQQ